MVVDIPQIYPNLRPLDHLQCFDPILSEESREDQIILFSFTGPCVCPPFPRHLAHRTGGHRYAERGGEKRKDFLPRFLQTLTEEIQRI